MWIVQCPMKVVLHDGATPYALTCPRRVGVNLLEPCRKKLDEMEKEGVIRKVTEPTDWCAPMVPMLKRSGEVRICVDLKVLNKSVKRERFILPTVEDITHKLARMKVFTKLDAKSGYHQIPLDVESQLLTTFITPFGRYCFQRLPEGIFCAPEIFQREMTEILSGVEGVFVYMDDILVFGVDDESHDKALKEVLDRLKKANIVLNEGKCSYRKSEIEFLGFVFDEHGMKPDSKKVEAIDKMKTPENVDELRTFLGSVQYLGRFIPNLSVKLKPLNDLLCKNTQWVWDTPQMTTFQHIKASLLKAPNLAFYEIGRKTKVSADASSFGIGGALFQKHEKGWLPVAFVSRTLTETKRRYAQIEKGLLAVVWTCERLDRFLVGCDSFALLTDHKPLVPLIKDKDIDKAPVRCQRMLLRLLRYNPVVENCPGKDLVVADQLSRLPLEQSSDTDCENDINLYVDSVISGIPITKSRLDQMRDALQSDSVLSQVVYYTVNGWPEHYRDISLDVRPYYDSRMSLSVYNGLLLYGSRIVVPPVHRERVLDKIHEGHFGIEKCRERARFSVWWPGLSNAIKLKVANCIMCQTRQNSNNSEPLIPTPLPDRPWQRLAADMLEFENHQYLVMVDYFSRYIELLPISTPATSKKVIDAFKVVFARFGVPEELLTDNGPQFSSHDFKSFAGSFDINHITSSPHFHQSNGLAERAVQTAKRILGTGDVALGLMTYRSTPVLATGVSPAHLLMGRNIRTTLPVLPDKLQPQWPDMKKVISQESKVKQKYASNFNVRKRARSLSKLNSGENVRVKLDTDKYWGSPVKVSSSANTPRSYVVERDGVKYRRNRKHLFKTIHPPVCTDRYQPQLVNWESKARDSGNVSSSSPQVSSSSPQVSSIARDIISGDNNINPLSPVKFSGSLKPNPAPGSSANIVEPSLVNMQTQPSGEIQKTRSGRIVRKPKRFLE